MNIPTVVRSRFALLGIALLAVVFAACGSTSSTSTAVPTATSASASTSSSSTAASTATSASGSAATPTTATTSATTAASPIPSAPTSVAGSATVLVHTDAKLGAILTNAAGMTLYTYEKDTPGKSVCNATCATNWPPLIASSAPTAPAGATGTFGTITRDDGSTQVTYNDMPLYTYIKDTAPGDTNGQDVGGVWYAALAAGSGTPTAEASTLMVSNDAALGAILTNSAGMTLYTYSKDTPGKSVCNGGCATNWPPLAATGTPTAPAGATGTFGTTTRDDGSSQVTYNGMPLYTFVGDTKAGDTTGQGVGGVWAVAKP